MSKKKHSVLGMAALAAAGAIQSAAKMRKTARAFIIQTVTTKHLPAQRNRKA